MRENHFSVQTRGIAEFEVQRSRFIGIADRVQDEAQCHALIQTSRQLYPQARHYCSAWILGDRGQTKRADDDKEPQGTAGLPMLHVLEKSGLTWVCCVAVRYFGGVLLGTGGLARAYTQTAQIAVDAAGIVQRIRAVELHCRLDYNYWGALQYRLESARIRIESVEYTDQIQLVFYSELEESSFWEQEIAAITAGTAQVRTGVRVWLSRPLKGETE